VEELALEAPLVLPADTPLVVQLTVAPGDERGQRPFTLHARPDDTDAWTRHATGLLSAASAPAFDLRTWPPPDAQNVAIDYDALARLGYAYGPEFHGVRALWKRGHDLFAEVQLPAPLAKDAERFALHPALLDAALHPLAFDALASADANDAKPIALPFA